MSVLIVTGGASGIGLACLEDFLKLSIENRVTLVDKNIAVSLRERLESEHGKNRILFIQQDLLGNDKLFSQIFEKTLEQFRRFDILLNNAGIGVMELMELKDLSDVTRSFAIVDSVLDLNLKVQIKLAILASFYMRNQQTQNPKLIVNVASLGGLFPQGSAPIYSSSKHGLVGFSHSMFYLFEEYNIRVNTLCPGYVETPLVLGNFRKSSEKIYPGVLIDRKIAVSVDKVSQEFIKLVTNQKAHGQTVLISSYLGTKIRQQKKGPVVPGEAPRGGALVYLPSIEELKNFQQKMAKL